MSQQRSDEAKRQRSKKRAAKVTRWRHNLKIKIVAGFGGSCGICGYDKCSTALEVHHLIPDEKEFSIRQVMANPIAWERIVIELAKCILVCSNCHAEIHTGITKIPDGVRRWKC